MDEQARDEPQGGLRAWAEARSTPEAVRTAGLEPGARPGTVAVPFPQVLHEDYKAIVRGKGIPKRVEKAPTERVPLAQLTAIQKTVNVERLENHLADPHLIARGARKIGSGMKTDRPVVVRAGGKAYLHDGHHRATAAMLRGETDIKARVVDLDKS